MCGCGGSDLVNGDRLRKGGDCASSDKVVADTRRVAVACKALRNMTSIISDDQKPDILQVRRPFESTILLVNLNLAL